MSLSFAVMIIVTMTATLPFGVIPRSLETRWDARSCQIGVYFGLSGPEPYGDQRGAFLDNSRSGGEPAVNVRQFAFLVLVVGAVGGLAVLGWRLIQNEQVDIRHSGSQAAVDCREIPLLKLRVRGIKCLSLTRRTSRQVWQRAAEFGDLVARSAKANPATSSKRLDDPTADKAPAWRPGDPAKIMPD